jgi:ADP-heptose:LPS heptosyltransferase/GT2 family glycosyltransferase
MVGSPDAPVEAIVAVRQAAQPLTVVCDHAIVTTSGVLLIEGWAAGATGIERIAIEVDARSVGDAEHGRPRADVVAANPGVPIGSGFAFERAIPDLGGRLHEIRIVAITRDGQTKALAVTVAPPASAFRFELDGPRTHEGAAVQPITGRLVVEGWALGRDGIAGIDVELDGTLLGQAHYGMARPDVSVAFPDWDDAARSGYTFHCPARALPEGEHIIQVVARSKTGGRHVHAFRIMVRKTDDPEAEASIRRRIKRVERDTMAGVLDELNWRPAFHLIVTGSPMVSLARGRPAVDLEAVSAADVDAETGALAGKAGDLADDADAGALAGDARSAILRGDAEPGDPAAADAVAEDTIVVTAESGGEANGFTDTDLRVTEPEATDATANVLARDDNVTSEQRWDLTFRSVLEQSWPHWRVTVLASGQQDAEAARSAIDRLAHERAARFSVIDPSDAGAWGTLLASGDASLMVLLASGDELGRDALGAFAIASGVHPRADCFYSDEFRLPPGSTRPEAFFKPDYSPALLLSGNYIGRPLVARPALLAATGATAESLMRNGFHDLALRCTEAAAETWHVTELLSRTDGGVAPNHTDGVAVAAALERRGIAAEVFAGVVPGSSRVRLRTPVTGKVSIIVPTCAANGYIRTCLTTLRETTAYKDFEIVCIDNIPDEEASSKAFVREHADKVVEMPAPFNWSRFNNAAAAASDGEYLLFLNDDIEIIQPGWLETMLESAAWPGVGIVGARLLYPNHTVQHAGMFLGDGMGRHAFRHATEIDPGYFGLALTRREVIAVTGACLLVRRDIFEQLGRFDEAHDVINNDLDFCLRAHRAGLRTIFTPDATLIHHELASRAHLSDDFDTTRFTGEWRSLFAAGDPYFNPRLSRYADDYRVDDEGVRVMYAGHPLIERESVKSILVVKLDHIGDFITSLPAIRRLKAAFPGARLTALVAPASAAIASIEPAIDECIPFEFFFARSELGERELTRDELDELTARLAAYRFDIAVDLRKHLSTRHLLLCAGARVLAGYDSLDNFPWLDVVLEWDGDKALQRKRSHIVDDLVNLVAAIDEACEPDRRLFEPRPVAMKIEELPEHVRHLFARPVVAIHPGSGNVMRQWPEKHIPPLIELLVEQNDVSVLLVGGRDDEEKVASIIGQVARTDRIASVAGQMPLRDLPRLLAACALFIGGNSGPKHIAAASGVPTIGIHSGVVDPGEWGPMGDRAVALYRDMSCAPCFLAKPEHCPRGLACVELLDPPLVHKMAQMFLARPANRRVPSLHPRAPVVPKVTAPDASASDDVSVPEVATLADHPGNTAVLTSAEPGLTEMASEQPATAAALVAALPGKLSRKRAQRVAVADPK